MPIGPRTRSRNLATYSQGSVGYESAGIPARYDIVTSDEVCSDVVHKKPYGQDAFSLTKREFSGGILTGYRGSTSLRVRCYDYCVLSMGRVPTNTIPTMSSSDLVARVMAQSGPLTPRVHLPLAVFELKDVPLMLRHAGNLLHKIRQPSGLSPDKEAASATLAYQFGWAPLVQDIGRMLDFGDAVRRRQNELLRAHTTKGIRRKVTLANSARRTTGTDSLHSAYNVRFLNVPYVMDEETKQWATIRWTVRDQNQIGRVPTWNEAFRASYGLNRGHIPIQIWKALPWTWAIDWFGDISNILTANYNSLYYKPSQICVMTTRVAKKTWSGQSYDNLALSSGFAERVTKQRVLQPPNTHFRLKLPFLDSFKLSILGSMTVLRIRGR